MKARNLFLMLLRLETTVILLGSEFHSMEVASSYYISNDQRFFLFMLWLF